MVYFGMDSRSIGNDMVDTYYIDMISSPCLLCLIAAKRCFDIYIPHLSNRGIQANEILTKYLAHNSVNFT